MTFSVKKIFKKEDTQPEQATAEHTAADDAVQHQHADENEQKKGKHGEPGFCCGSCS
ncbi:CCGSCS motif protein [Photobacterium sp. TY1-4]|uniref:CCGSCS motif protein n=1 Tax=Photobacterium sp. TY1-4 TaxID=2899122 RepID=UPI0021BEAC1A|nr:CCGSCS motif protein [Photobacterium sp. TY1-4]UXI03347.1 CCGSCS motif protein [Photobacterium sp. TY1-4]